MKLPDITRDDLVRSVNLKERTSVLVLMEILEHKELAIDEEDFKKACISCMSQSIMARLLEYALENESLTKLVDALIKASKIVYQDKFGEYLDNDEVEL